MDINSQLIEQITREVVQHIEKKDPASIVAGVSNRHVHLSREHIDILFGVGHELTKMRDLRQPGQFACKETITIATGNGVIEKIRVLGPDRKGTQLELSASDARKLRIEPPLMKSGSDETTPEVILIGPKGHATIDKGVGLAWRHIHLSTSEALALGAKNDDEVDVEISGERGIIFRKVWLRVSDRMVSEFHVDLDEANACGLKNGDFVRILI